MKRIFLSVLTLLLTVIAYAEIPAGYYSALVGKSGEAQILQTLHSIISSHTNVGYDGLYKVYPTADLTGSNQVWDMYSTCTFTHGQKKCGTYKNVCDCYNREHSVPQSWFGEAQPMKSDAFHVYPTDGKVNGQRSNYPYGECSGGTSLGGNALGRLGSSTFTGYTNVGKVFEPVDQYKGDFARTYYYMVACYYDKNFTQATEGQKVFTYSGGKAGLTAYSKALFLKWSRNDAVSEKETDRCDAVYAFQHNRNPFIDCKGLEEWIWGNKVGQAITQQNLVDCGCMEGTPSDLEQISFPSLTMTRTMDGVHFVCLPEEATIYVFTATGQLVDAVSVSESEVDLRLQKGFYMLLVTSGSQKQGFKVLM